MAMKIDYLGNTALVEQSLVAFLAPGKIDPLSVLPTLDWACEMARQSKVVVSGFSSRLEQDVWDVLARGNSPIVLVNAQYRCKRIPQHLQTMIDQNRLLIISLGLGTRLSRKNAPQRNGYVVSLASEIVFPSINPTSSLFPLYEKLILSHKVVKILSGNK